MMIRLHFTEDGQPLDAQSVVSHSSRVVSTVRDGHVELTILPQDQGMWARRAAVAQIRQHEPLSEQLQVLATLVDSARNGDGEDALRIAEKNAAILSRARELADSIGDATVAMADTSMRRIGREANVEVDRVRSVIRRHPLRSIGLVAIACAALAAIYRRR